MNAPQSNLIAVDELCSILRRATSNMDRVARYNCSSAVNILRKMLTGTDYLEYRRLAHLPEEVRLHLLNPNTKTSTGRPYTVRTAGDVKYALKQALNAAAGDLPNDATVPDADYPVLPRPPKRPELRWWNSYRQFVEWATSQGIPYCNVTTSAFQDYCSYLKTSVSSDPAIRLKIYDIKRLWRLYSLKPVQFPQFERNAHYYGIPKAEWPQRIREEFEEFMRIACRHGVRGRNKLTLLRSRKSHEVYRSLVRVILGYAISVRGLDTTEWSLRQDLFKLELLSQFMDWNSKERTGQVRHYHPTMYRQAARILRTLDGDLDLAVRLEQLADQQRPERARVIDIRSMRSYDELVNAAREHMQSASKEFDKWLNEGCPPKTAKETASHYQDSLLFYLAIRRPVRGVNLRSMRVGENVHQDAEGNYRLTFAAHEIKSARRYEGPFPPDVVPFLVRFIEEVRPILNLHGRDTLFLTRNGGGLTHRILSDRLVEAGKACLDLRTTPHFFRHLVPSAYLAKHPKELDTMRALLGHSTVDITLARYIHVFVREATRRIVPFLRDTCPHFGKLGTLQFP